MILFPGKVEQTSFLHDLVIWKSDHYVPNETVSVELEQNKSD